MAAKEIIVREYSTGSRSIYIVDELGVGMALSAEHSFHSRSIAPTCRWVFRLVGAVLPVWLERYTVGGEGVKLDSREALEVSNNGG